MEDAENPLLPVWYDLAWSGGVALGLSLAIWALVGTLRSHLDAMTKLVWAIVIVMLPFIGPILWIVYARTGLRSAGPTFRT